MISNGQRDILTFISRLMECHYKESKACILVIDEFFDYLDDANLVAFQYYISTLIDSYRKIGELYSLFYLLILILII